MNSNISTEIRIEIRTMVSAGASIGVRTENKGGKGMAGGLGGMDRVGVRDGKVRIASRLLDDIREAGCIRPRKAVGRLPLETWGAIRAICKAQEGAKGISDIVNVRSSTMGVRHCVRG